MNKKINNVEAAIMVILVALTEFLEAVLVFVPIIGWVAAFFVNICIWLLTQMWLLWKGARATYYMTAGLVELIPIINALPLKTAMLILTIIMHNSPKAKAILKKKIK